MVFQWIENKSFYIRMYQKIEILRPPSQNLLSFILAIYHIKTNKTAKFQVLTPTQSGVIGLQRMEQNTQ